MSHIDLQDAMKDLHDWAAANNASSPLVGEYEQYLSAMKEGQTIQSFSDFVKARAGEQGAELSAKYAANGPQSVKDIAGRTVQKEYFTVKGTSTSVERLAAIDPNAPKSFMGIPVDGGAPAVSATAALPAQEQEEPQTGNETKRFNDLKSFLEWIQQKDPLTANVAQVETGEHTVPGVEGKNFRLRDAKAVFDNGGSLDVTFVSDGKQFAIVPHDKNGAEFPAHETGSGLAYTIPPSPGQPKEPDPVEVVATNGPVIIPPMRPQRERVPVSISQVATYGQEDIDRWERGVERNNEINAFERQVQYEHKWNELAFKEQADEIRRRAQQGTLDPDFHLNNTNKIINRVRAEDYIQPGMGKEEYAQGMANLAAARNEQAEELETLNKISGPKTRAILNSGTAVAVATGVKPDAAGQIAWKDAPSKETLKAEASFKQVQAETAATIADNNGRVEVLERIKSGNLSESDKALAGAYHGQFKTGSDNHPAIDEIVSGPLAHPDTKKNLLSALDKAGKGGALNDEEKSAVGAYQDQLNATTQALAKNQQKLKGLKEEEGAEKTLQDSIEGANNRFSAALKSNLAHARGITNRQVDLAGTPGHASNQRMLEMHMAPVEAARAVENNRYDEQKKQIADARKENSPNLSMDNFYKMKYAKGERDVSKEVFKSADQDGKFTDVALPSGDVTVEIKAAGRGAMGSTTSGYEVVIRDARMYTNADLAGDGITPKFKAVVMSNVTAEQLESMQFNLAQGSKVNFVGNGIEAGDLRLRVAGRNAAQHVTSKNNIEMEITDTKTGQTTTRTSADMQKEDALAKAQREARKAMEESERRERLAWQESHNKNKKPTHVAAHKPSHGHNGPHRT